MTQLGIEPQSPEKLPITLNIRPIGQYIYIYIYHNSVGCHYLTRDNLESAKYL